MATSSEAGVYIIEAVRSGRLRRQILPITVGGQTMCIGHGMATASIVEAL